MDARRLREIFDALDGALATETVLVIRGGAAALALGFDDRTTVDIDVLPSSRFVETELRAACDSAGIGFNPPWKDDAERDYIEVVPVETLVLPEPSADSPYNTVYRGRVLTVTTPPAADLVVGKLKRLDPEDVADIAYLVRRFGLTAQDIERALQRLPERYRRDPVVLDNARYVVEDLLEGTP